jgi:hypothetical protein
LTLYKTLPAQIEAMIVTMRREKPTWGARKLRERCYASYPTMSVYPPAAPSTPSWTVMGWLLGKSKEVHDDIWLLSFMDYALEYFDLETRVLEPLENPFGPKVLPMS